MRAPGLYDAILTVKSFTADRSVEETFSASLAVLKFLNRPNALKAFASQYYFVKFRQCDVCQLNRTWKKNIKHLIMENEMIKNKNEVMKKYKTILSAN